MRDSTGKYGFVNVRSAVWWMMREALDPDGDDPIALPDVETLVGDLTAPKWWPTSAGKIQIESKEDLKDRLRRSTDDADAVGLALYLSRGAVTHKAKQPTPSKFRQYRATRGR